MYTIRKYTYSLCATCLACHTHKKIPICGAIISTSAAIRLHFIQFGKLHVDEWLYNGGPYELIVLHLPFSDTHGMGIKFNGIERIFPMEIPKKSSKQGLLETQRPRIWLTTSFQVSF